MNSDLDLDGLGSERDTLAAQYDEPTNVESRAAIYDFCDFQTAVAEDWSFGNWVVDAHPWGSTDTVLDLGSGTGHLLRMLAERVRLSIGVDLSPQMATRSAAASPGSSVLMSDALRLPFASGTLQGVLAAYVLFHVQDVRAALKEIRRVLSPDGTLVLVLNGRQDKAELLSVIRQAGQSVLGASFQPPSWSMHCDLESIEEPLEGLFKVEARDAVIGSFVFEDPEPACDWFASLRAGSERAISDGDWAAVLERARDEVKRQIADAGAFRSHRETGILVVTPC